jgi:hypothetical protein
MGRDRREEIGERRSARGDRREEIGERRSATDSAWDGVRVARCRIPTHGSVAHISSPPSDRRRSGADTDVWEALWGLVGDGLVYLDTAGQGSDTDNWRWRRARSIDPRSENLKDSSGFRRIATDNCWSKGGPTTPVRDWESGAFPDGHIRIDPGDAPRQRRKRLALRAAAVATTLCTCSVVPTYYQRTAKGTNAADPGRRQDWHLEGRLFSGRMRTCANGIHAWWMHLRIRGLERVPDLLQT